LQRIRGYDAMLVNRPILAAAADDADGTAGMAAMAWDFHYSDIGPSCD
jgi:hypothetical protein